ncbi:MAG: hypothetical protein K2P93_09330 [Alphaproteobacteria bacterium]|nr:hypothetical protein [Alphaproteobacteria bacterium]
MEQGVDEKEISFDLVLFFCAFDTTRKSTFRDEDLPSYPAYTTVKAVVLRSKDKGSNPSFCESGVSRGELSDGDVVINI